MISTMRCMSGQGVLFMTEEEPRIMSKAYPNKEAEAYKDFMNGRIVQQMKGHITRIFQRIKDFFANLRSNLFGKNSEDIFRDIAEGRMDRKGAKAGTEGEAATYYSMGEETGEVIDSVSANTHGSEYAEPLSRENEKKAVSGRTIKEQSDYQKILR